MFKGLPYKKRVFFAFFIDDGTQTFVREFDTHLAGFHFTLLNDSFT